MSASTGFGLPVRAERNEAARSASLGAQPLQLALELAHPAPALAGLGAGLALGVLRRPDGLAGGLELIGRVRVRGLGLLEGRAGFAEHALGLGHPLAPLPLGGLLPLGGGGLLGAGRGAAALGGAGGAAGPSGAGGAAGPSGAGGAAALVGASRATAVAG